MQLSGNNETCQSRIVFYFCVERTYASFDEDRNIILATEPSHFFLAFLNSSVIIAIKVSSANFKKRQYFYQFNFNI